MGIVLGIQTDHSKAYTLNIKVPNPIVTFQNFPSNIFKDLQKDIQHVILGSSSHEDYWIILHKLFTFLESSQSIMRENILKYSSVADSKDILNQLSQLEIHSTTLMKSFEILLKYGTSEENRESVTSAGFSAGQEIIRYFSDENGIFYQKYFMTSPYLLTFAGIYKSFLKLCERLGERQDGEETALLAASLAATLQNYKKKCIQERLDNIKMLRTLSQSYNLHDYSYEAQIRKDTSFGGKINDFYDKRPIDQIAFRDHPLNEATDADVIVAAYRNEVQREYELFFETLL